MRQVLRCEPFNTSSSFVFIDTPPPRPPPAHHFTATDHLGDSLDTDHHVEVASAIEPIDSSPTGMLVFGIMGAIAAHQRRQLAIEVNRGLTQEAEVGGTPGRAPLGYLNITQDIEGRQVRTIALDPKRAPLIRDAFALYASGEYSLMELAAIMEERGLQSRATKRVPERVLGFNRLAELLRNPYYVGRVRYAGKTYKGRHTPLVDEGTFQEVQDLLDSKRQSAERSWRHYHYLRGSLFCAECGSRLIYMRPKGNGGTYEYFVCSSRMQSKCSQGYHRAAAVEAAVEQHYAVVQLPKAQQDAIRAAIKAHVGKIAETADEQIAEAKDRLTRLAGEERKLLKAHYADQVSEDLFAEEQARIRRERAGAEHRVNELSVGHGRVPMVLMLRSALWIGFRRPTARQSQLSGACSTRRSSSGWKSRTRKSLTASWPSPLPVSGSKSPIPRKPSRAWIGAKRLRASKRPHICSATQEPPTCFLRSRVLTSKVWWRRPELNRVSGRSAKVSTGLAGA